MVTKAVKALAGEVASQIRDHGHLQDVYDPAQAKRYSLFRGAYAVADRKVRKEFVLVLNRKVKAEKRKAFADDFGPMAALMAWQDKTPTPKVLAVLDAIAGEKEEA